ncbi:MAG: L-erythro-3,5-diaminohexanoate dehydrogenase [Actinomycetota bacterium]
MRADGSPLGVHRVLEPAGVLPQAAYRLDSSAEIWDCETRLSVERLNLDAASYRQLRDASGGDPHAMRAAVAGIVAERGKMHNPVTGSGGMLIGRVDEVGPAFPAGLTPGQRVATLVSLTLTPLLIQDISAWDGSSEQVPVRAHAILFARSPYALLPSDLPDALCLAALDVCGAPALVSRHTHPGQTVLVVGAAGKSGAFCLVAARAAGAGRVIAAVLNDDEAHSVAALSPDRVVVADATDPISFLDRVAPAVGALGADLTVVCVNVPGAEGSAILATRDGGSIIFFSMTTSFTAAALGAEGVGKDVTMLVGNGYVPGHAELTLRMLREAPSLRSHLERRA